MILCFYANSITKSVLSCLDGDSPLLFIIAALSLAVNLFLWGDNLKTLYWQYDHLRRWDRAWSALSPSSKAQAVEDVTLENTPPKTAKLFLWMLMRGTERRESIRHLDGDYERVCDECGRREAIIFYWSEVLFAAKDTLGPGIERLFKWGAFTSSVGHVCNWIRQYLHL